jgi:hypothetical protein
MEKTLRQLETFSARGSDGNTYSIRGYEHLGRVDAPGTSEQPWEPLGVAEYKLADGRPLRELAEGRFVVVGEDLELRRQAH